ncbi:MAG: hypothetical protein IH831_08830, partial [Planctomycetes bacterium]|nr:hypothetical protein [Planctomycetota bacterium]
MSQFSMLSLEFPTDDVAVLTLNDPAKGVNVLSQSVLKDLDRHLTDLEKRDGLAGLV